MKFTSDPLDAESELDSLVPILFSIADTHNRIPYFVDAILDLLRKSCPDADSEWDRYSELVSEAHKSEFSRIRVRMLHIELLYIITHRSFPSECAKWRFEGLDVLTVSTDSIRSRTSQWIEHIGNALSSREEEEQAMYEFIFARLQNLTDEIGIDAAEWLQPPNPLRITDEMVDKWIEKNPDVQHRLQGFGLS